MWCQEVKLFVTTVTGSFKDGGFNINLVPPRLQPRQPGVSPFRTAHADVSNLHNLHIAFYVFAHSERSNCSQLVGQVNQRHEVYFNQDVLGSPEDLWDTLQLYGYGQAPDSHLEDSLVAFYLRFHTLPTMPRLLKWLVHHKLNPYGK